jgi:hypothetical protein
LLLIDRSGACTLNSGFWGVWLLCFGPWRLRCFARDEVDGGEEIMRDGRKMRPGCPSEAGGCCGTEGGERNDVAALSTYLFQNPNARDETLKEAQKEKNGAVSGVIPSVSYSSCSRPAKDPTFSKGSSRLVHVQKRHNNRSFLSLHIVCGRSLSNWREFTA